MLDQLSLDIDHCGFQRFPGRYVVGGRVDRDPAKLFLRLSREGIDGVDSRDHVVVEEDPYGPFLFVCGEYVYVLPPNPESAPIEIYVVPLVLGLDELVEQVLPLHPIALLHVDEHAVVGLRRAQAVDARDTRHDEDVLTLEERIRRGEAQLVDLLVDGGVLLDVRVRGRDVGLGLVVVVVAHKEMDRVPGKEGLELAVELGSERLVVGHDEGGLLDVLHHVGHGEGLAGARDPEEDLLVGALPEVLDELFYGLRLVPRGRVSVRQLKSMHRQLF